MSEYIERESALALVKPDAPEYGKAVFNVENIGKDKVSVVLSKYWRIVGTEDKKKLTLYKGKEGGVYKGEILIRNDY